MRCQSFNTQVIIEQEIITFKMNKEKIIEIVKRKNKILKLNPLQKEAIKIGLLEDKNLVVSSPTSSGKTLLAELAGFKIVKERKKKMIYLAPLVALAREKYEDFKKKYESEGIKVALSVGDYDSPDWYLKDYDWICTSNEKLDSLIRHGIQWIKDVGLIVVDEVHLLNDFERGPTLEILLVILKKLCPRAQFLLFSATITNSEEIGEWLGAKVLKSEFRPVPLYLGIATKGKILVFGKGEYEINKNLPIEEGIVENTLLLKKQLIFFLSTRKNAESLAERLSELVFHFLNEDETKILKKIANKIKNTLSTPTQQCKKLAQCIEKGVAFYHSGILFPQRIEIEEAYKKGLIKVITSTTSLAYGVNLPNFRAVIRDVKRYYPGVGSFFIPVLEIHQMFGRSGRVNYDKWGEGILIAKNEKDFHSLKEIYIQGKPEEIESKIESFRSLRMHILSLFSSGIAKTLSELFDFLKETFFAKKIEVEVLQEKIEKALFQLEDWGFLETFPLENDVKVSVTFLGKRVAKLYLDPESAYILNENLRNWPGDAISLFLILAKTWELKPSPNLLSKEVFEIEKEIWEIKENLPFDIPAEFELEYEEFLKEMKMALILKDWIEEKEEKEICEKFNITPGEFHSRLEIVDWLLYSAKELAKILGLEKEKIVEISKLRERVYYGIKEELLELVKLKGIGRKRARILFNSGIKTIEEFKKLNKEELVKIFKSKKLLKK